MQRTALFPGSFNPFTVGHADIVRRALQLFDKVIVAIGVNSAKDPADNTKRIARLRNLYADNPRVEVIAYDSLTADLVRQKNASCIIRGIRNEADLAYENEIAQVNFSLFGIETVYLLADPELRELSSTVVRELQRFGKDISQLLP
ncbi:MAG: pantetheine-phosphate adenylyltransferase [Paludibacteraceae bacterium]|nr:pantetheine-phosphate adenylyltransferase [Paludibacteraceae bacterium]